MSERKSGRHIRTRKEKRQERSRVKYAPDDPLRYLHVPWSHRESKDPEVEADQVDYDQIRDNLGEVVTEDLSVVDT